MTFKISKKDAARLGLSGVVDGRTTPERRALQSTINHREYKSGLERRYAEFLESRKILREIIVWQYEGIRLQLGGGATFMPDFAIIRRDEPDGRRITELHEVKGFWREAAKVRMKVAVDRWQEYFDFYLVTAGGVKGGQFVIERWSK